MIVAVLVVAVIIVSILRPSSRISFGVFFEREIEDRNTGDEEREKPED